ncbi:MAG: hypothetical protein FWC91_08395 [Defluviitaleaceae bacterium]|nr:hypothetical protein [Defluviitaleaceae bacterium]
MLKWLVENPIARTLASVTPMVWVLIVLGIFGERLCLIDRYGNMTQTGQIITISVYLTVGFFIFLTNWFMPRVASRKKSEAKIQGLLITLTNAIHGLSNIDEKYISASVFYAFNGNRNKPFYQVTNKKPGIGPDTALNGENSFGKYLLDDSPKDFEFLNDVVGEGESKGKYVTTQQNKLMLRETNKAGSTVGYRIIEHQDNKAYERPMVQAVLFSSSFGYEICNGYKGMSREAIECIIENVILPPIVAQLTEELKALHKPQPWFIRIFQRKWQRDMQ